MLNYDLESQLERRKGYRGSANDLTSYDYPATECRTMARSVYTIADQCSTTLSLDEMAIKNKLEEILDIMNDALVISGEVFLKQNMLDTYNSIPTIIEDIETQLLENAIQPAVNVCNTNQRSANSGACGDASNYVRNHSGGTAPSEYVID